MRVLITGGAGFVGRHLTRSLVRRGCAVRVLDALVPQVHGTAPPQLDPEVEFIHGDVRNQAVVQAALEGVDAVFHLAAEVGVGQSMYEIPRFVGGNGLGTAVLLQEIVERRAQIRKVVVASSMTVYGEGNGLCKEHGVVAPELRPLSQLERREWDTLCPRCGEPLAPAPTPESRKLHPTSIYAATKRDQEEYCLIIGRAYGIPMVALRYFNIYGPGQALSNPYTGVVPIFCSRIVSGEPALIYEDGRQSRDFVHVSDVVQANLLALEAEEADYQVFNVSSGELWTVAEVARLVERELGAEGKVEITGQYRAGDIRHCHADLTQIRRRLGYAPAVGLKRGLPEVVRWAAGELGKTPTSRPTLNRAAGELAAYGLLR